MPRPYKGHNLTEEQRKLAADNINLVWWYIDKKLLRRGRIEPREIDEVAGYLIWHLCMAAEGFDSSKGYKFSSYAEMAFKGGFFRYKQLTLPYEAHFVVTDFAPSLHNNDGYDHFSDPVLEPTYHEQEPKFVHWEDIKWLFDLIETTPLERQIIRFYYELKYNLQEIADLMNLTKERIRQINDSFVDRIKEHISEEIKLEDFYVAKY